MRETVNYFENQYRDGQLILIGQYTYELKIDNLNNRYFVINQNDERIYLDQIESVAVVQIGPKKTITASFFYPETSPQMFSEIKKIHYHFFFDILYIVIVLSVIALLSVLFHFFQELRITL